MPENFDTFHALDSAKQKRILDAALLEFAEKGFELASTNTIAKSAKIGKGMLFYYFGSKEQLFDFLCAKTIAFANETYLAPFHPQTGDFLKRYQLFTQVKRKILAEYPLPSAFLELFYKKENFPYITKYSAEVTYLREQIFSRIYENIDYSFFRPDIDGKAAMTYIKWIIDSYQNDLVEQFKRGKIETLDEKAMAKEWQRFDNICRDMRKLFYKEDR